MGTIKSGKYAIVGVGKTQFGRVPGSTPLSLNLQAAKMAIEEAGLTNRDIDGILTHQPYSDPTFRMCTWVGEYLGLHLKHCTDLNMGGATPCGSIKHAMMAIETGMCNYVLCSFGENLVTGRKRHGRMNWTVEDYYQPFGFLTAPHHYAHIMQRHIHQYGTKPEQFGAIAIACRNHAALNPDATLNDEPLTMESYLNQTYLVAPLRRADICLVSDGGCACVVTSAERAKDLNETPVYILGVGEGYCPEHSHYLITAPDMAAPGGGRVCGEQAYRMADLSPQDIDFAEFYDCFTSTVMVEIEDYGFCKKGEGGAFVEGGRIELGGELPINTHGGLLAEAHVDGFNHVIEAVKQLRHKVPPERQVKEAQVGLVTGFGGFSGSYSCAILGR